MPRTASTITNACIEQTAVVNKSTLSKKDEAKVVRLQRQIEGDEESSYPQEYEFGHKNNTDQNIAVVYLAGTKEVRSVGSAASDVVTAYENLLDKIEAEKSSKQ
ncbi:uncharacterized protein J4E92_005515 [Alternaria infectoria]|uniref:uncharacterized protein n=1 Tax=Alternaria infectoria TaxID=45303 RepID=UPI00221F84EE|nr:uncharacterized protein J4E92_005515 [Alternaria infectoria]KAI4928033.1 hypothetical protein J4E92_005515 [Alternaria infectoria]